MLQQRLLLAVLKQTIECKAKEGVKHVATALTACGMRRRGIEKDESDDEDCISLVPDQREGKTKVIK